MKTQQVTIASSEINKWATIERSMLASIAAAAYLEDRELVEKLTSIKEYAQRGYGNAVSRKLDRMGE